MADQISKEERRLIRQKRKKRNRLIAIIVTIVVLAVVGVGGYFGVSTLIKAIGKGSEETTVEEQSAPKKGLFAKEEPVKKSISEFAKYNNEATDDEDSGMTYFSQMGSKSIFAVMSSNLCV